MRLFLFRKTMVTAGSKPGSRQDKKHKTGLPSQCLHVFSWPSTGHMSVQWDCSRVVITVHSVGHKAPPHQTQVMPRSLLSFASTSMPHQRNNSRFWICITPTKAPKHLTCSLLTSRNLLCPRTSQPMIAGYFSFYFSLSPITSYSWRWDTRLILIRMVIFICDKICLRVKNRHVGLLNKGNYWVWRVLPTRGEAYTWPGMTLQHLRAPSLSSCLFSWSEWSASVLCLLYLFPQKPPSTFLTQFLPGAYCI